LKQQLENKLAIIMTVLLNRQLSESYCETGRFVQKAYGEGVSITKQGYCEARKKISPTAFIKLADALTTWYYGDDEYKT
jgi:hypothetical protein